MGKSHRKSCKKIAFSTAKEAYKWKEHQNARGLNLTAVYKCPHCKDKYHVTSQDQKRRR